MTTNNRLAATTWIGVQTALVLTGGRWWGAISTASAQCTVHHEQRIVASDGGDGDSFGSALATEGVWTVVGAPFDDDHGEDSGSVYFFHLEGSQWVQRQKIAPSEVTAHANFGAAVGISGTAVIVGAPLDDTFGLRNGSAFVYRFDGLQWVKERRLHGGTGAILMDFGRSVSISNDLAVVGAPFQNEVHVFRNLGTMWPLESILTAWDPIASRFGARLAARGDVVAASGSDRVYVFRHADSRWNPEQRLTGADAGDTSLGSSLAIDADRLVAGGGSFLHVFHFDGQT